ncbi:heterokaryon incompatibility protein-domain-containing protein [Alternaria rosae]|uniref:heterokaryon incompatibility protein-domain-containing protein n=1 Tax=Alternaria rosae TaxID=1187941 RepID=UPI001E8EE909|nr:heterokaryon incompatibility protein-domain-containing protein [Alternaria rosae]KAH6883250.1 heterokaryon incompatibility protein-domain-containing protein [Alternaria rosae]
MVSEGLGGKRVRHTTAWRRRRGMPDIKQKAEKQRYLTREEEQVLLASIRATLQATGEVRSREVRELAGDIKRRRSRNINDNTVTQLIANPGGNWPAQFLGENRRELNIRKSGGGAWLTVIGDFVAMPSDVEQLCSKCVSIDLRLEAELARRPNESRGIITFQPSPDNTGRIQCKLCRFVEDCAWSWDWPPADKFSLRIHHMDSVYGPTLATSKILLSISMTNSSSKKKHQGWIVPIPLGTDASIDTRGAWGQLGKAVDLNQTRDWLRFCDQNHTSGCRMPKLDTIPFFRLIDCTTRSIVNAPDQTNYTALSYCWGPSSDPRQEDWTELPSVAPLVIEDALKVTRELGIPYLWVDRYCNSQSDPHVLPIQLQHMHAVYRSAYVTIVAGSGIDPTFGLPGVSTRERKPQVSVQTHGYYLHCIPDVGQEIRSSRWSTRGWTYQENYLSKRRLVFTETQTYFQCWNMHCCESTPLDLEKAHTKNLERFRDTIHTFRVYPQKGIGKTSNDVEQRIQEYLGRDLTKDSDALNAFLGIFQAFQELEDPVYNFWGLPISDERSITRTHHTVVEPSKADELYGSLLSSLAWSTDFCDNASTHLLTRRLMFPSWTWAAWKCLPLFSRKSITMTLDSPSISFKTYQGQSVKGERLFSALRSSNSTVVFEPCIYLDGWVTDVRLLQDASNEKANRGFQVLWPIPTHRVTIVADTSTATSLRKQALSGSFPVLLLGSDSIFENNSATPTDGLKDVHAIIMQPGPGRTHTRLGVVSWSRLGMPSYGEEGNVLRIRELVEVRRIVPPCRCGCKPSTATFINRYMELPDHVMEFRRAKIRLV